MKDLASRRSRLDYSKVAEPAPIPTAETTPPAAPSPAAEASISAGLPAAHPASSAQFPPTPPAQQASLRPLLPHQQPLKINPSLSVAAAAQASNAVSAAKTSGDYRFQSVSDVVRAALERYFSGALSLTQQAKPGPKKRQTVQLSREMMAEYQKLPTRSRGEIVERAVLTFLGGGFGG